MPIYIPAYACIAKLFNFHVLDKMVFLTRFDDKLNIVVWCL